MEPIDLATLSTLFARTRGRVRYLLGAKAPPTADSADIQRIDCSGWTRWAVARSASQKLLLPDGSQAQLAWARQHLRPLEHYSDVQYAAEDSGRLFVAFLSPAPGAAWPRHVWLVRAGETMESCSSLGVGSRHWNHPSLRSCRDCFELVTVAGVGGGS